MHRAVPRHLRAETRMRRDEITRIALHHFCALSLWRAIVTANGTNEICMEKLRARTKCWWNERQRCEAISFLLSFHQNIRHHSTPTQLSCVALHSTFDLLHENKKPLNSSETNITICPTGGRERETERSRIRQWPMGSRSCYRLLHDARTLNERNILRINYETISYCQLCAAIISRAPVWVCYLIRFELILNLGLPEHNTQKRAKIHLCV